MGNMCMIFKKDGKLFATHTKNMEKDIPNIRPNEQGTSTLLGSLLSS
jgi:hypothetical protein